jgi:signal transduction histidine kinase
MQSIGQLAAGIAHEINTPMQYIGDSIRFLSDAFADMVTVVQTYESAFEGIRSDIANAELLDRIEDARKAMELDYLVTEIPKAIEQSLGGVDRVSSIVGAMKQFSHPGTEEKTKADLNRLADTCIIVSRNEWKYVADMKTNLDLELPYVWCLPDEISQVVLNLIINAAQAIADVVRDGSKGKGTITVSTQRVDGYAEIRVADTGAGIPPHIQSRIFDPFFTTKPPGKGTGQGLAISYAVVVKKHAGTITFETTPGHGTCFVVRLPLEPLDSSPAAEGGAE